MKKIKEYLLLKNPGILAMGFVFIMMLIFFPLESLLNFAILSLAMAFILFFISFMTEFDEDNPLLEVDYTGATGALGGLGGASLAAGLVLGGLANFASNGIQQLKNSCGTIDWTALATSTGLGVAGAGIGAGISKLGAGTLKKGGKAYFDNLARKGTTVASKSEIEFVSKYGTYQEHGNWVGNLIGGGVGAINPQ